MICTKCGVDFVPVAGPGRPRKKCYSCNPKYNKRGMTHAEMEARGFECGCGRDYATVPLSEANWCPKPVRKRAATEMRRF